MVHGRPPFFNEQDDDNPVRFDNSNESMSLSPSLDDSCYTGQESITIETLEGLPSLNLRLRKSSSFISLLEATLSEPSRSQMSPKLGYGGVGRPRKNEFASQQVTEKLKASNFSASLLRIGTWERVAKYEGDLVAKCYYAKKKLVWELLESSLKRKIEILWTDILAIRATIQENEPGILEIELNHPPTFHHETDPQPRKHTNWKATGDFTDGQAPAWRRHYLKFPPGVLDKPYEKLLQCDSRLFELSQQPFPSLNSPYFFHQRLLEPTDFSFDFNLHGQRPQFNPGLYYSLAQMPTSFVPQQLPQQPLDIRELLTSPSSVMEFSPTENPRTALWVQGANNFADTLPMEQVQGQMSIPSANPVAVYYQNNDNYMEAGSRADLGTEMLLNHIENTLMNDSQVEFTDEKYSLSRMASLAAMIGQSNEGNYCYNVGTNPQIYYGQDVPTATCMDFRNNEQQSNDTAAPLYQQPVYWVPPLVTEQQQQIPQPVSAVPPQIPMNQFTNNTVYPRMDDDFTTANDNNEVNRYSG